MAKINITTNLIGKEEVFNVLALAESIGSPVLLIGEPGTGKTNAVLDYAEASQGGALSNEDVFILETDEGTKSNEIKGHVDMEALTTKNQFKKDSPITRAKYVVINEVDKANAGLRNSLLGVMNEKILFNGIEKTPCNWEAFVATCNKIPEDEKDSPFWDRFLITFKVNRLTESMVMKYYKKGGKDARFKYSPGKPTQAELDAMDIPLDKLQKVMRVTYNKLSDRSLSFIPTLAKHIAGVWGFNVDRALVKAVELLISKEDANVLAKSLVSKELRAVYDKVDQIASMSNYESYTNLIEQIDNAGTALKNAGRLSDTEEQDLINMVERESDKLEFLKKDEEEMEGILEAN